MRLSIALFAAALATAMAGRSLAQQPATPPAGATPTITGVTQVVSLFSQRIEVKIGGSGIVNPASYILFLDGRAFEGPNDALFDGDRHILAFRLRRSDANSAAWTALLGSPTGLSLPVTASLGVSNCQTGTSCPPTPSIFGDGASDRLELRVVSGGRLAGALLLVAAMVAAVWFRARGTTLLKDNLLPQIAPEQQPYSLGRWQMAFWFTLIFASFAMLYVLVLDFNTISTQALWLMGISGATGISAIAVDAAKDTPADAANRGLKALGLATYADVVKAREEIAARKKLLDVEPPPPDAKKLALEINDRELLLRAYKAAIKPFVSEGWYKDLTTDLNGNALHRVQVFYWTWALGIVFVIGVYTDLAMPQFNSALLLLMGISSAGYIGFKYPEPQQ